MSHDSGRQAGELTDKVMEEAELLIGKWDQEGGLSHRELARRLRDIFLKEKRP